MTNTTLANVQTGDEILQISKDPAARVTVGIPWGDEPQRLIVTSVSHSGKVTWMKFANGGRLLPVNSTTPCVVA